MTHTHDHNNPNKLSFSQHKTSIIYRAVSPQCRFVWNIVHSVHPIPMGYHHFPHLNCGGICHLRTYPTFVGYITLYGPYGFVWKWGTPNKHMLYHRRCILKVYPSFEQIHIPFIWLNYNHSLLVAWKWLKLAAIWAWFPVYPCPHWGLDITTWGHDQVYPDIFIHINSISHIIGDFHCISISIPLMLVKKPTLFRQFPVFQVNRFHPVPHLRLGHPLEDVPHGPNGQDGRLSARNGLSEPLRGCSKHVEIHGGLHVKRCVHVYLYLYIYIICYTGKTRSSETTIKFDIVKYNIT